jgi:excisionase family DNA binding protein
MKEPDKLLTVREVSGILNISEKEVIDLSEQGIIPAYKVAGLYLRFKRDQIEQYKKKIRHLQPRPVRLKLTQRISDFLYFNDFYILATLIILLMLVIIFQ